MISSEHLNTPDQEKKTVLFVAQVPPPYYGQALVHQSLLETQFSRIRLVHVPMGMSLHLYSVGTIAWVKVFRLLRVIRKAFVFTRNGRADLLYYSPGGSTMAPVLRDCFALPLLRMRAKKTVYHFQAAGLTHQLESLPGVFRWLAMRCYGKPDGAILLSGFNPRDDVALHAKEVRIIPNGIPDMAADKGDGDGGSFNSEDLGYIGVMTREKGIFDLLEVLKIVASRRSGTKCHFIGGFLRESEKAEFNAAVRQAGLVEQVVMHGLVVGEERVTAFQKIGVLCFLSYYRSESFGNVVVEAMSLGIPVIATKWRGAQEIVVDGETGYLVEPRDVSRVAEVAIQLVGDTELRRRLGEAGRRRFQEHYSLPMFTRAFEDFMVGVAGQG